MNWIVIKLFCWTEGVTKVTTRFPAAAALAALGAVLTAVAAIVVLALKRYET